jgi:GT2 family glycosyltransferase
MGAPAQALRVSAIVVNRDRRVLLADCLESLRLAFDRVPGATELIVVDNGSADGSANMVRAAYAEATVIELPENAGFSGGLAEGLRVATGDWILTLNNDATIEPNAIAELLRVAEQEAEVFAVAAQLRFAAGEPAINSAGIGVDRLGVAYDRLLGEHPAASEVAPTEVFGASAGAALYNRALLTELGGPDESFFAFLEDADLAWRARMRGWRSFYAPGALVHHWHSATARHNSPFKHFLVGRNRVRLLAKNATAWHLALYAPAAILYDLAYVAYAVCADRTLAPLRGRLAGVREWRAYRRAGTDERRPVTLDRTRGIRAALRRRAAWARKPAAPELPSARPA